MFEYVMSGLSFSRLLLSRYESLSPLNLELLGNGYNLVDGYLLSGLFNAWQEKNIGLVIKDRFKFNSVHVDSGGLQMALYNKAITPEVKSEIYQIQGKYGDVAMCFDNIPLHVNQVGKDGGSQRTRLDTKTFLVDKLKEKAIDTGKNINEQLRSFREMGSNAKVMMIAQGNEPQDFVDFIHWQFDQIDEDLKSRIGGIALADTCIGNGTLESIDMTLSFGMLDIPKQYLNHVHYLGVGSITRLIPAIEMKRSGYLSKDLHISFDSTSHTSGFTNGKGVMEDGKSTTWGRFSTSDSIAYFNGLYDRYFNKFYGEEHKKPFIEFIIAHLSNTTIYNSQGEYPELFYMLFHLSTMYSVDNFMKALIKAESDPNYYYQLTNSSAHNNITRILHLNQLSSVEDIWKWRADAISYIDSKRIKRSQSSSINEGINSLDGFF